MWFSLWKPELIDCRNGSKNHFSLGKETYYGSFRDHNRATKIAKNKV
jgi:hypothetical protein